MDTFKNSVAQTNVQFPIETVIEPIAGENYSRVIIFAPVSKATEYLPGISSAQAGSLIQVNSANYGTVTGALLKTWLVPFFTSAQAAVVGVAIYDDSSGASENTLAILYERFKFFAYFKFGIAETDAYAALQKSLCDLCAADVLYSRLWIGISDSAVLTEQAALVTALKNTAGTYRMIYNPDKKINAALAQLGRTLSTANKTGTPVGNSIDMVAFSTIKASGKDDGEGNAENLTPTEKAALDKQKIGYNTYVGDGTENVVTEGALYSDGSSVGAEWIKAYITYMCKVQTANLISRMNSFRNNSTYQAILLILQNIVKGFIDMERLDNFVITAPVFKDLPKGGDTITVPNAWQADYLDGVRIVTVYGTLYITKPTR